MGDPGSVSCESCGAALPTSAKFCPECGTPVAAALAHEVRKTVTLLFTDVTGSTALGEQLDPEAYRGVMGRYFEVARAAVERHGGTVEKFVGDAVLAVFGIPEVREDDALRAVRAAHEMTRALATLSEDLERTMGVRLEVRTGVNTGSVVAGSARAGGSFATGDAVNTAARLEQAAAPGEVLLGALTHDLVRDAVQAEPVPPVAAKGKSEVVPAFRLLRVLQADRGRARRTDGRLVGREREIRVLHDALDRTLESGRGHLVTVVGAPGIGKTRLVSEFLAQVGDRAEVLTGRCVSYGTGITFWPVVQLLRQALDLVGGESDEVVGHALTRLMSDAPDGDQVTENLMSLLGHAGSPGDREATFWAVRRALEQLALRRPLVVTVDDLHWAEPTLLDLIERVRDEVLDLPLLLICQSRPELLDDHPDWGGGSLNSVTFGLEPFTSQQTTSTLEDLLGGQVPADVATAVWSWAGGNPLFVEEVAGHLVDRGLLRRVDDDWALAADLAAAQVPPTVAALLSARVDRLPERERRLLERIAVVGLEVTTEDAVVLSEGLLDAELVTEALGALVHRDLLRRTRSPAGDIWAFRHILLRDTAYDALPKSQRAALHERYADRVAELTDDVGAERSAFVAHHLEQALRLRSELAPQDPSLAPLAQRAARALGEAAEEARERDDVPAALALLERAASVEPLPPELRREVLVALIQVLFEQVLVDDASRAVDALEAVTGASDLDRSAVEMLGLAARMARSDPVDPAHVATAAERCADLARAHGHPRLLAMSQVVLQDCLAMRGRWDDVRVVLDELARTGSQQDRRHVRMMTGAALLWGSQPLSTLSDFLDGERQSGQHSPADRLRQDCMRAMVDAGLGRPEAVSRLREYEQQVEERFLRFYQLAMVGGGYLLGGEVADAARVFDEGIALMMAAGDLGHASTQLGWVVPMRLELGEPPEAVRATLQQALDTTSPHDVVSVALSALGQGLLLARTGRHEEAAPYLEEALRVVDEGDQLWQQAEFRRWCGLAARWRGDREAERRWFAEAHELFVKKGIVYWADETAARVAELDRLSAPR